jgi:hypothetical protein
LYKVMWAFRKSALVIEASVLLAVTRFGLRWCHFRRIRSLLSLVAVCGRRFNRRTVSPAVLVWALETAKRRNPLPGNCLTEALTAEALFKQFGHQPVLCIGASKHNGKFAAHAWLEQDKVVMVGGPEAHIQEFTRFPDFIKVL